MSVRIIVLCVVLSCSALAACGSEPARMPEKAKEAVKNPPVQPAPEWTEGVFPVEDAFFGLGEAKMGDKDGAKAKARTWLQKELGLLATNIKADHEEQVAEIISRYPPEKLNKFVDDAVTASVDKAEEVDRFEDAGRKRSFMLIKLPFDTFYETLLASPELPEEQKKRIRDTRNTLIDGTLQSLGRVEE